MSGCMSACWTCLLTNCKEEWTSFSRISRIGMRWSWRWSWKNQLLKLFLFYFGVGKALFPIGELMLLMTGKGGTERFWNSFSSSTSVLPAWSCLVLLPLYLLQLFTQTSINEYKVRRDSNVSIKNLSNVRKRWSYFGSMTVNKDINSNTAIILYMAF